MKIEITININDAEIKNLFNLLLKEASWAIKDISDK